MSYYNNKSKYKLILKTKSNLWGFLNLKQKFKKQKWKKTYLNTKLFKFKKNMFIKQKKVIFKKNFKYKLQEKQKLKFFYGNLPNTSLKKFYRITKKKNSYQFLENFIAILESRLNIILYRSNLTYNIFIINNLIKTKRIIVNNKLITNIHYVLKPGDIIKFKIKKTRKKLLLDLFKKNYKHFLKYNIKLIKQIYMLKHIEINYKTLSILYLNKPKEVFYPADIDLRTVSRFYI